MKRRGLTYIEMMVTVAVLSVVIGGLYTIFVSLYQAQQASVNLPISQQGAQIGLMTLENQLRGATLCASTDSGCTLNAAVESTSATGLTMYARNTAGTLVKYSYSVSGGNLVQSLGSTNTTIATGVNGLTFTYYQSSSGSYYTNTLSSYTPTSSTTPHLAAVGISFKTTIIGASINGVALTTTYNTMVRLRNSPLKSTSTG